MANDMISTQRKHFYYAQTLRLLARRCWRQALLQALCHAGACSGGGQAASATERTSAFSYCCV